MTKEEYLSALRSAHSQRDWDEICDRATAQHQGYPDWWFGDVVLSGMAQDAAMRWRAA